MWSIIGGRTTALALRHRYLGYCCCVIAGGVDNLEGNLVDATVPATYLYGLVFFRFAFIRVNPRLNFQNGTSA
jgi:hypothetical protein